MPPTCPFFGKGAPGSTSEVASDGGIAGPTSLVLSESHADAIACTAIERASHSWIGFLGARLPPKSSSLNLRDQTTRGHQMSLSTTRMTTPMATIPKSLARVSPASVAAWMYEPRPGTRSDTPLMGGGASQTLRKNHPAAMETMLL